jgi:hypothetical protein
MRDEEICPCPTEGLHVLRENRVDGSQRKPTAPAFRTRHGTQERLSAWVHRLRGFRAGMPDASFEDSSQPGDTHFVDLNCICMNVARGVVAEKPIISFLAVAIVVSGNPKHTDAIFKHGLQLLAQRLL